jgi:hypothetical protein
VAKPMVRCKACGYVMEAGNPVDRCPACGAPKTAFEPYSSLIGERRRRLLALDLHPISVHFSTAFTYALLALLIISFFLSGEALSMFLGAVRVITLFLPLLVAASLALGWIDGKTRFRKIRNSRILKSKIACASILLSLSIALLLVNWIIPLTVLAAAVISLVLAVVGAVLVFLLGKLGVSILNAAFPGN